MQLLKNIVEKLPPSIAFALRGVKSNRDGIGARIKVVSKSGVQYNHQTSSVCYASSTLGPVHFGLGGDNVATRIEITWPSGILQTLENVAADRTVKVTEPESTAALTTAPTK